MKWLHNSDVQGSYTVQLPDGRKQIVGKTIMNISIQQTKQLFYFLLKENKSTVQFINSPTVQLPEGRKQIVGKTDFLFPFIGQNGFSISFHQAKQLFHLLLKAKKLFYLLLNAKQLFYFLLKAKPLFYFLLTSLS